MFQQEKVTGMRSRRKLLLKNETTQQTEFEIAAYAAPTESEANPNRSQRGSRKSRSRLTPLLPQGEWQEK
ncbi:hypothetical protein [Lysobacter sp. Root76]|uniref:hypothetical protein n=1 Tax=Lysobacter sp. Root76 TaxID=1736598 RepID=UPI000B06CFB2|nr:hypothetical protein [Lysobacter sp. Root76]